jgi:uncharacterized protein (DUF302 family)
MIRTILATAALTLSAAPALADIVTRHVEGSVPQAMDRIEAAVTEAGATIFARVDHGGGAASVEMELGQSELLIFGNPKLGTPAMQDDPRAGLYLPLKILVFADAEGRTTVAYEEVEETFDELNIDDDAAYIEKMEGALKKFAEAAEG